MRNSKRVLAGVAAGALGAALVPFVGVGAANAAVTSVTASTAVAAASAYQAPSAGGSLTNLMDLIYLDFDDSLATSGAQSVVSIRLDSAPADDTGTGFAAIQLSANSSAATTGSGYGYTAAGALTSVTVTSPANYVWARGSVVTIANGGAGTRGLALEGVAPNAGNYGFTAWVNDGSGSNTVLEPGEPYTTGTLTVGGAVTSFTVAPASQSVGANQSAAFAVTAKDSAGRATFPTGNGTTGSWGNITTTPGTSVNMAASGGSTTDGTGKLTAAAFLDVTTPLTDLQGTAYFEVSTANAGSYALRVGPGGTLPGTVTAGTASLTVSSVATLAGAIVSGPKAVSSNATTYTAPAAIAASSSSTPNDIFVPITESKVSFTMSATSSAITGALLPYTIADGPSGSSAGVTGGAYTIAINSDKQATFQVTASAAAVGDYYTVTVGQGSAKVVYKVTYGLPQLYIQNVSTTPKLGTTGFVVTNTATTIVAKVTDQYGQPLSNILVRSVPTVSTAASGVTGTDGLASINIPAPGATISSQTVAFTALAPLASSAVGPTSSVVTLIYNASGAPSSLSLITAAGNVTASAAATQYVDVAGTNTNTWTAGTANTLSGWMPVTVTVGGAATPVSVNFTAPDNTYFSTAAGATSFSAATVTKDKTSASTSSGTATVYVKPTKTGTVTVTATAGTLSTTITWKVANTNADGRVITVTPAKQDAAGLAQVTATVKDAFGNPVANAALNFSEDGVGNFASGTSTLSTATGPTGAVTVDVISTTSGDSKVTVLAGTTADYSGLANSPVTGAPAGVGSGLAEIKFSGGAGDRSIAITGSRTTVSGKPGIEVLGLTKGLVAGKTVVPYVRFPGGEYTQGTARPAINNVGEFEWSRKTGKKSYVYFTNDDGAVTSNRIIIAAK